VTRVLALSIHADYRCGHSGVCCGSGWTIPVEAAADRAIREALASGRLDLARSVGGPGRAEPRLVGEAGLPDGCPSRLGRDAAGRCLFFEADHGRLCAVHRQLGVAALPSACRQFPRVAVLRPDAVAVTLSHYCPTAARLLFREETPLTMVEGPAAFPADAPWEGLDAREAWPPLLRPGVLMGWDAFALFERHAVATLARPGAAEAALASLAEDVASLRGWRPADGPLVELVALLARERTQAVANGSPELGPARARPKEDGASASATDVAARRLALVAVARMASLEAEPPLESAAELAALDARWVASAWDALAPPLRRYLAARGFASWVALQGTGLRSWLASLETALAVVRVLAARRCGTEGRPLDAGILLEAFRGADLLLVHHVDPERLARELSVAERVHRG